MPPPTPYHSLSYPNKPRPAYFLIRPGDELVPLIALDELPPTISIPGIQRSLSVSDTIGMLNLGLQKSSGGIYHVVYEDDDDKTATAKPVKKEMAIKETNLCRHWCTHGICKWNQQCRYKHTMPLSLSGLSEVGLTDWPLWFRTLNPGFFVNAMKGGRLQRPTQPHPSSLSSHLNSSMRMANAEARLGKETLGEQIVERLRDRGREGVRGRGSVQAPRLSGREKEDRKGKSVSVAVERAAARDARRWGDESEGSREGSEEAGESSGSDAEPVVKREAMVQKGKLVDV